VGNEKRKPTNRENDVGVTHKESSERLRTGIERTYGLAEPWMSIPGSLRSLLRGTPDCRWNGIESGDSAGDVAQYGGSG
jgi:hypothetical protein